MLLCKGGDTLVVRGECERQRLLCDLPGHRRLDVIAAVSFLIADGQVVIAGVAALGSRGSPLAADIILNRIRIDLAVVTDQNLALAVIGLGQAVNAVPRVFERAVVVGGSDRTVFARQVGCRSARGDLRSINRRRVIGKFVILGIFAGSDEENFAGLQLVIRVAGRVNSPYGLVERWDGLPVIWEANFQSRQESDGMSMEL